MLRRTFLGALDARTRCARYICPICFPLDHPPRSSTLDRNYPTIRIALSLLSSSWTSEQTIAGQGPNGCAKITWRMEPGGYLKSILNARVYDIAVRIVCTLSNDCKYFQSVLIVIIFTPVRPGPCIGHSREAFAALHRCASAVHRSRVTGFCLMCSLRLLLRRQSS
jgi:hypothetical protein